MSAATGAVLGRAAAGRRYAGLGARRLWLGLILLVGIQMAFGLSEAVGALSTYSRPELALTAWAVIIVADLAVIAVTRALGDHLPNWMFGLFVAALTVALLLDFASTWGHPELRHSITSGVSATLSLLIALPTRPEREVRITAYVFTAGTAGVMALDGAMAPPQLYNSVFILCQMCFTVVVATIVIAAFRSLIKHEIERELSTASLSAPRLTVGAEQSEQLARLDLAAESLLAAVAEGRVQLPLDEAIARRAGVLATELRLHLLESRRQTWLDLAIEESTLLADAVRIDDVENSAGLLSPRQRGALLSALWLIAERPPARRPKRSPTRVVFARATQPSDGSSSLIVPIRMHFGATGRYGVDPGVWEHVAQVGSYREVSEPGDFRIEIDAVVPVAGARPPLDR